MTTVVLSGNLFPFMFQSTEIRIQQWQQVQATEQFYKCFPPVLLCKCKWKVQLHYMLSSHAGFYKTMAIHHHTKTVHLPYQLWNLKQYDEKKNTFKVSLKYPAPAGDFHLDPYQLLVRSECSCSVLSVVWHSLWAFLRRNTFQQLLLAIPVGTIYKPPKHSVTENFNDFIQKSWSEVIVVKTTNF